MTGVETALGVAAWQRGGAQPGRQEGWLPPPTEDLGQSLCLSVSPFPPP